MHMCLCVCTVSVCVHMCLCVCTVSVCVHMCLCVCTCACVCVQCLCVCTVSVGNSLNSHTHMRRLHFQTILDADN